MPGAFFSALGRRGPLWLAASLAAGLAFPALARAGHAALPASAFLLTLGSLLTAGLSPRETLGRGHGFALGLVWIGLALPLATAAALRLAPLDPALRSGVLLSLLAPPVGSAAAIAAMVGLRPRLALAVSLTLTLIAPVTIPLYAQRLGLGPAMPVGALTVRLFTILGAAAVVAAVALRWRRLSVPWVRDRAAGSGVAVLGLVIVGLATTDQFQTERFGAFVLAATLVNISLCALSSLAFASLGFEVAGTLGLLSGNRNVTLAWAAASFGLAPEAESYVAACVVPVLILPLLIKAALALHNRFSPILSRPRRET